MKTRTEFIRNYMKLKLSQKNGFTLVEISIVMIIIGLLIGGMFGGMKLVENMQVNKTVQDLKAIESAALTFKDTYGRLPGDMPNTAARLPSCTDAPCATGGDGDRQISPTNAATSWTAALDVTWERYTFWHHLLAANMLAMDYMNTVDPTFGEGQPTAPIGGGYRMTNYTGSGTPCAIQNRGAILTITPEAAGALNTTYALQCGAIESVDRKTDDGDPYRGKLLIGTAACTGGAVCGNQYSQQNGQANYVFYDVSF